MDTLSQDHLQAIAGLLHEHADVLLERQELSYLRHLDYILTSTEQMLMDAIPNRPAQNVIKDVFQQFHKLGLKSKPSDPLHEVSAFTIPDVPRAFYIPTTVDFPIWDQRLQIWDALVQERGKAMEQVEVKWKHVFDCQDFVIPGQGCELGHSLITDHAFAPLNVADELTTWLERGYLNTPATKPWEIQNTTPYTAFPTPIRAINDERLEPITALRAFSRARVDSYKLFDSPSVKGTTKPLYSTIAASPPRLPTLKPIPTLPTQIKTPSNVHDKAGHLISPPPVRDLKLKSRKVPSSNPNTIPFPVLRLQTHPRVPSALQYSVNARNDCFGPVESRNDERVIEGEAKALEKVNEGNGRHHAQGAGSLSVPRG